MQNTDSDLISVVMPCFNAAPHVEAALASALAQSYPRVEILVVDDGSIDGSTEIVQALEAAHPDRITLLHSNRIGPYAARNVALARARGAYVAFLDADARWHPDALRHMHEALETGKADVAVCGWREIGEAGDAAADSFAPAEDTAMALADVFEHGGWPLNSALIRRPLIDALRGFSERAPSAMDTDFWLRMLARQPGLAQVEQVLAFQRRHNHGHALIPHWQRVFDAVAVRADFARRNPARLAHFAPPRLAELMYGPLLREAYRCHWRNDTESARRLFRLALLKADWRMRDLKHLLASLLPAPFYRALVELVTRRRSARHGG